MEKDDTETYVWENMKLDPWYKSHLLINYSWIKNFSVK